MSEQDFNDLEDLLYWFETTNSYKVGNIGPVRARALRDKINSLKGRTVSITLDAGEEDVDKRLHEMQGVLQDVEDTISQIANGPARIEGIERQKDSDPVASPSHYLRVGISPQRIAELYDLPFDRANVIKYLLRAGHKEDELQDLEKATWNLLRALARLRFERGQLQRLPSIDTKKNGMPFTPLWMKLLFDPRMETF